ncbi:MAG: tRNA (adenosine(37)-N6)-threonylcarbamoyltransferase complex ATPase subunit type 1 TsaE [Candidatus Lloydbacteria bacterium RIFCSPHIGHO2_01_FULL_41_20]|uniref:tRNA threonylcarbamoyladenosine biosynthesis protein TsaE n=1 Tax=Candidatus Lloydbacteria bacterium RIFCSPHIGHO2_01_FULL_41_20 TaxID=1798657 RepID=A0A1G2CS98_9BACT|nr:MAG: tRNA (adenosine(37)-N6)-threonylcarbamoyltransferase complex ATPase subunit type 1 TsaE [Candidatus Lloydbacteria bacterium RIFCSPHIGHO2_01_FULL_41_20]
MRHESKSLEETRNIGKKVLLELVAGRKSDGALVLVCSGDLGSGKTAFTKELAKILGVKDEVTSPTFVIQKKYTIPEKAKNRFGFSRLVHIDAYRIENINELKPIHLKETAEDRNNLVVIEWGEKIKKGLPKTYSTLHFLYLDENTRQITLLK